MTLVLCNAFATETLPIFLDRLTTPLAAVALSMSVVLLFGEVIPQAVCSRYGLAVGAQAAWLVRVLMVVSYPIAAPLAAVLDRTLGGGDHANGGGGSSALFRRAQLKALVDVHAEDEGLGGNLTVDEVAVIRGALDLSAKTAKCCLTPIERVFALPTDARLDGATLHRRSHHLDELVEPVARPPVICAPGESGNAAARRRARHRGRLCLAGAGDPVRLVVAGLCAPPEITILFGN